MESIEERMYCDSKDSKDSITNIIDNFKGSETEVNSFQGLCEDFHSATFPVICIWSPSSIDN